MRLKLLLVAGARPNYMKIAPIYWAIRDRAADTFAVELVHTGQHYDATMSESFLRDLHLPKPTIDLAVGSGSHAIQTARVITAFEAVVLERQPDIVVVVGDVNSTVGCAIVTAKTDYAGDGCFGRPLLVHVEAGLRSRDRSMPEEINRIVTDALADVCFTTCRDAGDNLLDEGIPSDRIHFVGNPMIDSLRHCLPTARRSGFLDRLGLTGRRFALCTLHRPSNVDKPRMLRNVLETLAGVATDLPILLPIHPRTRRRIHDFGLGDHVTDLGSPIGRIPEHGLVGLQPLSYLEMLQVLEVAEFVLTDSGGVQEETTVLGVPCVTLRENTERPVTVTDGSNVLSSTSALAVLHALASARCKAKAQRRVPDLWDGRAGERIVATLRSLLVRSDAAKSSYGPVVSTADGS